MPDNYFARYLPLLIHILLASGIAGAIITLSWLIGERKPIRAKLSAYECGMTPIGDFRDRFSVKFYMVAMLFILFDVEAVLLFPGHDSAPAQSARRGPFRALGNVRVYGRLPGWLFLRWKKGVLDWGMRSSRERGDV